MLEISSRRPAAAKSSRVDGTASLRAVHDATSSWNHRGRLGPRQAQQPPKEEAAASPDATTTAARHLELPCTPPQPPPDEKPVAISSTAGPQSVGQALAVIDDESCSTPAIQNALTATVAGLERRIEDNCLSLTKHYLQALIIVQRENLCLLVLHTGSAFDRRRRCWLSGDYDYTCVAVACLRLTLSRCPCQCEAGAGVGFEDAPSDPANFSPHSRDAGDDHHDAVYLFIFLFKLQVRILGLWGGMYF